MTNSPDSAIGLGLLLPFQIAQLHTALNAQAKAIVSRHGDLNLAQWRIVRVVALGIENTTTPVRKAAGIDKSQFSKMLSILEQNGYVTLRPCDVDKRQHVIELTKKARLAHERLGPVLDERQRHLVASLSEEELAVIYKAIRVMAEAAEKTDFAVPPPISEED